MGHSAANISYALAGDRRFVRKNHSVNVSGLFKKGSSLTFHMDSSE